MLHVHARVAVLSMVVATLTGCGPAEPDAESGSARERFQRAVVDQDAVRAREAAAALERELPDTPEAVIEVARLLGDVGEMNQARWMLQEARTRHPERVDLVIGLAETSLRVGDATGALDALRDVPPGTEHAPYVEVLRARAEIQLGLLDAGLAILEAAGDRF